MSRLARGIFLAFMTWLLVGFLPAHTRGRITVGATGDDCCVPTVAVKPPAENCCATDASAQRDGTKKDEPSARDRANCAVCFFAAGLLSDIAVTFDHAFAERAFEAACAYDAQVRNVASRLTHHGRDPPIFA